jgi:hypothetical protein
MAMFFRGFEERPALSSQASSCQAFSIHCHWTTTSWRSSGTLVHLSALSCR